MAVNLQKANRIIFQPTKDNEEKLKRLAKENGLTISGFLNQVISDLDDRASLGFEKLGRSAMIDVAIDYGYFEYFWSNLQKTLEVAKTNVKPISECLNGHCEFESGVFYDEDSPIVVELPILHKSITAYPIVNNVVDIRDRRHVCSWNNDNSIAFAVAVFRDEATGCVTYYQVFAIFAGRTIYSMFPEFDVAVSVDNENKAEDGHTLDVFVDPWHWEIESCHCGWHRFH